MIRYDVRYWHEADLPIALADVRSMENSGHSASRFYEYTP
jgi:hypothetical protein